MRRDSARVDRCGRRESLESGGESEVVGSKVVEEAVGRRNVVRVAGIDLER